MQVVGDPEGVAALKALASANRDYLKFLLGEARSASDHVAPFRAADGTRWEWRAWRSASGWGAW